MQAASCSCRPAEVFLVTRSWYGTRVCAGGVDLLHGVGERRSQSLDVAVPAAAQGDIKLRPGVFIADSWDLRPAKALHRSVVPGLPARHNNGVRGGRVTGQRAG